jgi:hypothetical protein
MNEGSFPRVHDVDRLENAAPCCGVRLDGGDNSLSKVKWIFYSERPLAARNPLSLLIRI